MRGIGVVLPAVVCFALMSCGCHGETIGEVKMSAEWMQVAVNGTVTYVEPTECYIESQDRSGGIRVEASTAGIAVGDLVTAMGTYSVVSGEPTVGAATLSPMGGQFSVQPFAMNNRTVGGSLPNSKIWDFNAHKATVDGQTVTQYRWEQAGGAGNTGVLVRICGDVNASYYSPTTGAKWFYVDDGFGAVSDFSDTGVLVYSDADVKDGQYVAVTGVSSVEPSLDHRDQLIRAIRARGSADVRMLRGVPDDSLFSDEFNKPALDWRWVVSYSDGHISLTEKPGWLALTSGPKWPVELYRIIRGDWNLEVKLCLPVSQTGQMNGSISLDVGQPGGAIAGVSADRSTPVAHPMVAGYTFANKTGDTWYFRLKQRGDVVTGQVSSDGVSYSEEHSMAGSFSNWISISVSSTFASPAVTGYCDYIRFTPVSE